MLAIVIPCYNEEESLEELIKEFIEIKDKDIEFNLIFINDGSTDNTREIIEKYIEKYAWIRLIKHDSNMGLARSLKDGVSFALGNGYDYILQMDCDLTHPPSLIPKMLDEISGYDMVVASRYVSGGGMKDVPNWRVYLSMGGNLFFRILLGIKTLDATSGYRLLKREVFEKISLESDSFQIQLELTAKSEMHGLKIKEIPFILTTRKKGKSKFKLKILLNYIPLTLKLFLSRCTNP